MPGMRLSARVLLPALLLSISAGSGAAGQTTIVVPPTSPGTSAPCQGILCGQSFTAPAGVDALQSFSFTLNSASSLTFELYAWGGTAPMGAALFTQAIAPTTGFETLTFAPGSPLAVTGGGQYVAMVRVPITAPVAFAANTANPYAGGVFAACGGAAGAGCQLATGTDLAFTAVFAAGPTVVPEPATATLLGLGLLGLAGVGLRRRQRAA
jgi:hypothetical protein